MNKATLFLCLANLAVIGALPFTFFKRGRFNIMWSLTAAPYPVSAAILLASYVGLLPPITGYDTEWSNRLAVLAVPFCAVSIALIFLTLGTHRTPLALWHQQQDGPQHIVSEGPYHRIRHPFYAAFLLALLGAAVFAPSAGTFAVWIYAAVTLNFTARREERRLMRSEFGAQYVRYMHQTGRFWPKLRPGAVNHV